MTIRHWHDFEGGDTNADGGIVQVSEDGVERWVKAVKALETDVPLYLENTAGGDHAMARHFDTIARLWDAIGGVASQAFTFLITQATAAWDAWIKPAVEAISGVASAWNGLLDSMAESMHEALKKAASPTELMKIKDRNHITIIIQFIHHNDPLNKAFRAFVEQNK